MSLNSFLSSEPLGSTNAHKGTVHAQLKMAQHALTEQQIRTAWRGITHSFPTMCVNDGVIFEYNKRLTAQHVERMVHKLTKCPNRNVACPLFQYFYDPKNSTPHHVSAITLTHFPGRCVLSFFDPKGRGSLRKKEESMLMHVLGKLISTQLKKPCTVMIYDGTNLQRTDNIGLCQLFSLFYMYEYIVQMTKPMNSLSIIRTIIDPNRMVNFIVNKHGKFDQRALLSFWNTYFTHIN